MRLNKAGFGLILCLGMAGCSDLPSDGPDSMAVASSAVAVLPGEPGKPALDYALVDITETVAEHVPELGPSMFNKSFGMPHGTAPEYRVRVGDTLVVTIYESSAGTLLGSSETAQRQGANNQLSVAPQVVDQSGKISVPFAGDIVAKGLSLREIRREIESRLSKRALEPQAIVSIPSTGTGNVTVVGDGVGNGGGGITGGVSLRPTGDRVLEVLARAGGIRYPGFETFVALQRGRRVATIYYPKLISDPRENIYVQPDDIINVSHYQRKFGAFGATNSVGQTMGLTGLYPFEGEKMSLQEALSRVGGLSDTRADAVEIYLYRVEERETLQAVGASLGQFKPGQKYIPTIYRMNLRDPSGFFLAQHFPLRDKDIVYVANARSVEVGKFFDYLSTITGGIASNTGNLTTTREAARALGTGK